MILMISAALLNAAGIPDERDAAGKAVFFNPARYNGREVFICGTKKEHILSNFRIETTLFAQDRGIYAGLEIDNRLSEIRQGERSCFRGIVARHDRLSEAEAIRARRKYSYADVQVDPEYLLIPVPQ